MCRRCGEYVESRHRHDYRRCGCGAVGVDGGLAYLRRIGDPADAEELSQTTTEPLPELTPEQKAIREKYEKDMTISLLLHMKDMDWGLSRAST